MATISQGVLYGTLGTRKETCKVYENWLNRLEGRIKELLDAAPKESKKKQFLEFLQKKKKH